MPTDIDEATDNFKEGVDMQSAMEWQNEATESADEYEEDFGPVLERQNDCAEQLQEDNVTGYAALQRYANCVSGGGT